MISESSVRFLPFFSNREVFVLVQTRLAAQKSFPFFPLFSVGMNITHIEMVQKLRRIDTDIHGNCVGEFHIFILNFVKGINLVQTICALFKRHVLVTE